MPKQYLHNIRDKKHINVRSFYHACEKRGINIEMVRKIFEIRQCACGARNKYFLTVLDEDLYRQHFSRFFVIDDDHKVNAALHGSSKRGNVNAGILNYFVNYKTTIGQSLIFVDGICLQPPTHGGSVLLVENINTAIKLSPAVVPDLNLDELPIIYSKGNEIASDQFRGFLGEFDNVICFFDYDVGGLKTFKSLHDYLGNKATFYTHPNLDYLLKEFGKKLTEKQFISLQELAVNKETSVVVAALRDKRKWLEQEIFQAKNTGILNGTKVALP